MTEIGYIYSEDLVKHCNKLLPIENRASIVQDLLTSYNLLTSSKITVVKSEDATADDLKTFHSSAYVELLESLNSFDTNLDEINDIYTEYGLGYDCPIIENIFEFCQSIAGSSLTAAKLLISRRFKFVINWFGGWHHAGRELASGFCYVNDIVIAIQALSRHFPKILYIDLDIHHGDGVQNAFEYSHQIFTLSFHKYSIGFFPTSGSLEEIGSGNGKYYHLNVPFKDGLSDDTLIDVFSQIFPLVFESFQPDALVVQCGADGLTRDPLGECNLTLKSFEFCIKHLKQCDLPTLYLGGGGYNPTNAARLWTHLTSLIVDQELDEDIPEDSNFFEQYAPSYEIGIEKARIKDCNTPDYLNSMIDTIKKYCGFLEKF